MGNSSQATALSFKGPIVALLRHLKDPLLTCDSQSHNGTEQKPLKES